MEGEQYGFLSLHFLNGIKAGPVRRMVDTLPMQEMAKVW